ncbi:hypothetical protein [Lapillicoccus sp.]|uniref:hypothetical protein n=1 Tax=Lapillicoccus sp. TaxID=1909287 RepID=UPI0032648FF1
MPARSTAVVAHRDSVQVGDSDLVSAVVTKLGTRLVCFVVAKDKSTITRWRNGQSAVPDESSKRLRLVYQIFRLLEGSESDHTIRAWFIGMNPQLDDDSPLETIEAGRYKDALIAARAFLAGG